MPHASCVAAPGILQVLLPQGGQRATRNFTVDSVGPDGASASRPVSISCEFLQEWEVQYTDQLQKLTLKASPHLAVKLTCTSSTRIFGQRRDVPIKVPCSSVSSSSLAAVSVGFLYSGAHKVGWWWTTGEKARAFARFTMSFTSVLSREKAGQASVLQKFALA